MELKLEKFEVKELSESEVMLVNGGGAGFYWLGQVCGYFSNLCNAIDRANQEAPVSVAMWN